MPLTAVFDEVAYTQYSDVIVIPACHWLAENEAWRTYFAGQSMGEKNKNGFVWKGKPYDIM